MTVDLGANTASGGDADGGTFTSIENLVGSRYADRLTGDGNDNVLLGQGGADVLNGGAGEDTASYVFHWGPVTVNLETNTGKGGDAEGDTLTSIENLRGSSGADMLTGDAHTNVLEGGRGRTRWMGARDEDTATYAGVSAGVTASLGTSPSSGGVRYVSIKHFRGSRYADTLTGTARPTNWKVEPARTCWTGAAVRTGPCTTVPRQGCTF